MSHPKRRMGFEENTDKHTPMRRAYAALLVFVLLTSALSGQITYIDVPDQTLTAGQFQAIDLNSDATDDVVVSVVPSGSTFITLTRSSGTNPLQTLQFSGTVIDKISFGESIGPASGTYTTNNTSFCVACMDAVFPWSAPPVTDVYVGFRMTFMSSGTTHYAWMLCDVPTTADQITVKAFGWEGAANTAILAGDQGPLPVELLALGGQQDEFGIRLHWIAAAEMNYEKFEIERSRTGNSFYGIGELRRNEAILPNQAYSFWDTDPSDGMNYYRLKKIDYEGNFEYSHVISIHFESEKNHIAEIYPNPCNSGILNVDYLSDSNKEMFISVYDMRGRIVLRQAELLSIGNNSLNLDLSGLVKGIYTVKLDNGIDPIYRKLILE